MVADRGFKGSTMAGRGSVPIRGFGCQGSPRRARIAFFKRNAPVQQLSDREGLQDDVTCYFLIKRVHFNGDLEAGRGRKRREERRSLSTDKANRAEKSRAPALDEARHTGHAKSCTLRSQV